MQEGTWEQFCKGQKLIVKELLYISPWMCNQLSKTKTEAELRNYLHSFLKL